MPVYTVTFFVSQSICLSIWTHMMSWSSINILTSKTKLALRHASHWQTWKQHIGDFSQAKHTNRTIQSSSWDHVVINNRHVERQLELQMRWWLGTAWLHCQGHRLWFKGKHKPCVFLPLGLVRRHCNQHLNAQTTKANTAALYRLSKKANWHID